MIKEKNSRIDIQDEIKNKILRMQEIFYGIPTTKNYYNHILSMLFLKYISDVKVDVCSELNQQKCDAAGKEAVKIDGEVLMISETSSFSHVYAMRHEDDVGSIINEAFRELAADNPKTLSDIFNFVDFDDESIFGGVEHKKKCLRMIIEIFHEINLRPSMLGCDDFIGDVSSFLVEKFSEISSKHGEEFITPVGLTELLAEIVDPRPGDSIYDPCCGSGSLLIQSAKRVKLNDLSIYGHEFNLNVGVLCKLNMILHGVYDAKISFGYLSFPPQRMKASVIHKFDKLVSNSLFFVRRPLEAIAEPDPIDKSQQWIPLLPPRRHDDYSNSIKYMIECLSDGGVAAIVVPQGILFRNSPLDRQLRERMIKSNVIEAIISLPSKLFTSTSITLSIIVLKKGRDNNDIVFIDASKYFESGKRQNRISTADVARIINSYKSRMVTPGFSAMVPAEEIERNDFNLTANRYIADPEIEQVVDIVAVRKEIERLEGQLDEIEKKIDASMRELERGM